MSEQQRNLDRVATRIEPLIMAFARDRMNVSRPKFHMVELTNFVSRHHVVAPDSAGRILRHLRKTGALHYGVVSRADSLYELTYVGELRKPLKPGRKKGSAA